MEVRSQNGIKGLFSEKTFNEGAIVIEIAGKEIDTPTRTSIELESGKHIEVGFPVKYINHSCFNNIKIKNNNFVATKDINVNEELLMNYNSSESKMSAPFICRECGQWVKGKQHRELYPCLKYM